MNDEVIQYLPTSAIEITKQVRDYAEDNSIDNLALSLREVGLVHPLRLRREDDLLIVVDGERRLRAAMRLGWERIAAIVEERELSSGEVIQRQLIANCMRKSLSEVEAGRAIEELIEKSRWPARKVAEKLGFSQAKVCRLRAAARLSPQMQELVRNGSLPASTACALAKVDDSLRQDALVREGVEGRLSRDAAVAKVKKRRPQRVGKKRRSTPGASVCLGEGRFVTVTGHGLSLATLIAWLGEVVVKAEAAQSQGMVLEAFLLSLKEQAAA